MSVPADLTGQRFGSRVVLRRLPSVSYGHATHSRWAVRCDCGQVNVTGTTSSDSVVPLFASVLLKAMDHQLAAEAQANAVLPAWLRERAL